MNIFSKKESLIQNITYMAVMAAINVVFVLLTVFLPYLYVLLLFILPLTSTFVMLFCKKRYYFIYALATIGLCFLASINNIGDTIFYIIPSIATGAVAGILIENKINSVWLIMFTTITHFSLSLISLPLIKLITGVDFIDSLFHLFSLGGFVYKEYLVGPILIFTSLAQMTITYLILKNEIKKINIEIKSELQKFDILFLGLFEFLSFILMIVFVFVYKPLILIMLILGIVPSICLLVYEISLLNKIKLIIITAIMIVFPIFFAILYPLVDIPIGFCFIGVLFFSINIPTFCRVFQK